MPPAPDFEGVKVKVAHVRSLGLVGAFLAMMTMLAAIGFGFLMLFGKALLAALQKGIAERGLAAEILPIRCMGFCAIGPNVRLGLGKDAQLLHGVTLDQAPDILDKIAVKAGKI